MVIILIFTLISAAAVFFYLNNNILTVAEYDFSKNSKNKITAVHLSDLHCKCFGRNNKRLFKKIKEAAPDIVFFTGDLITSGRKTDRAFEFMKLLNDICPVCFVFGNHEIRCGKKDEIGKKLENIGISVLEDEIKSFEIKNREINILGLFDNQGKFEDYKKMLKNEFVYPDRSEIIKKLEKCGGVRLLMSHYPENFALIGEKSYNGFDYDLYLCGHAHGGQFRFPPFGGVYAPGQGFFPKYSKGIYKDKNKKPVMILSGGLGCSTIPLRIFNPPEIVRITI